MADTNNVWAATLNANGACVYAAPLGTTLPTTATEALDADFVDLGWVSEDGFTNSIKRDITKHYAFGGDVVKVTQDKYTETVQFALLESSADVLGVVYGVDSVTENGAVFSVEHNSLMLVHQVFAIDFIDGDKVGRIVIRDGQVTEIGDLKYVHKDLTMYDVTVDVYRLDDGTAAVATYFDATPGS